MSFFIFIFAAMLKSRKRIFWKWIGLIAAIYVLAGIALYFLQEKFLFRPDPLPPDHRFSFAEPFRQLDLRVNEKKTISVVQFTVPDSICRGVVLYFHGNRQNIERYARFSGFFTRNRYEVWMIDYPGYGKSTGPISEDILYNDGLEFYKMAAARFSKDSLIIYGKSLGTGIAAKVASVRKCRRLILETPYYSMEALMRTYAFMYPVGLMTNFHFPVYEYVMATEAPITLFHGTKDRVVPYSHSKRLMKLERSNMELVTVENAGHNDLAEFPVYGQKLDSILQVP